MKKELAVLLSVSSLFTLCGITGCAADEETAQTAPESTEIVLTIGDPMMTVNGEEKEIDPGLGTTPVIINDRTLLPIREVVEELGGTVGWNGDTREVTLGYNGSEIVLTIDSTAAALNDVAQTLDTAPTIINDRTMLPIRFIAEGFGWDVEWNGDTQEVTITMSGDGSTTLDSDMILIEGGTFTMGSPTNEPERDADEVQHNVTVGSFYMAPTEVSQSEYAAVMGINPSEDQGDDLPVESITWYDAIAYCNALSEAEGLTPCYTVSGTTVTWDRSADGYRLPTEAEWEYACRAGSDTPFNFGDYVNDSDVNCYNAYGYNNDASGSWVNGYLEHTVSVNEYNANAYGLYNMHGNAAEWVWDWYGDYSTAETTDPTGPESGNYKVVRGGGWNDMPKHIRSAYRMVNPADTSLYSIGMRLVRNAANSEGTVTSTNTATSEPEGNTLIAYFSQTGNTQGFAEIIQEMTGADVFRIERAEPYSATHNSQGLYAEALDEYRSNASPELAEYLEDEGLDINDYDTIILGCSNWWASIPAPVRTFLQHYDLSDKTIIPFCSMGGGRFGQIISAMAKLAPNSTIKEGLSVTYSSYDRDEISEWLGNSLNPDEETSSAAETRVRLTWNGNEAVISLTDNATTRDFISKLPMTVTFEDFNSTEKIAYMDTELAVDNSARGCDPSPGTVALYVPWGNLSVFYEDWSASNDLVTMGRVESGLDALTSMTSDFEVTIELAE